MINSMYLNCTGYDVRCHHGVKIQVGSKCGCWYGMAGRVMGDFLEALVSECLLTELVVDLLSTTAKKAIVQ
jgi:hypothetical protein